MNLEDHFGDVVRKARAMSNVSAADAAQAAGLTEGELGALEESGQAPAKTNIAALAKRLGLQAPKLEAIARGWGPSAKDIGQWRELRCVTTSDGGMAVNCYLIWDEVSREAAVFDTGWN